MKVFVESGKIFTEPVKYTLSIFAQNKNAKFLFVEKREDSELTVGAGDTCDLVVSERCYDTLARGVYSFEHHLSGDCFVKAGNQTDYLSTAFYMINGVQEYASPHRDDIGRFDYAHSYQAKYGNVTSNHVQTCFEKICEHPKLNHLKQVKNSSGFFLSHDIDSIHGALLQDGFFLLKNGRPHLIFNLLLNAVLQRPDWFTVDTIMKIEDEHSFKSTFFWLVNRGKINERETNADYNIHSSRIQSAIKKIAASGWTNGLHKSISPESFKEELQKSGITTNANRNHYLKFNLPELFEQIEQSSLAMDTSLGFADAIGFRNSYGLPFVPYNLKAGKPFSFVEAPLNIMDTTLHKYMNLSAREAERTVIEFLEANAHNSLIAILWHNNYFTPYKFHGYLQLYKTLLAFLHENRWPCHTPAEIVSKFSLPQYK